MVELVRARKRAEADVQLLAEELRAASGEAAEREGARTGVLRGPGLVGQLDGGKK